VVDGKDDLCQETNLGKEGSVPTNAIHEKGLINTIHAEKGFMNFDFGGEDCYGISQALKNSSISGWC
jgi:hypothetical protein